VNFEIQTTKRFRKREEKMNTSKNRTLWVTIVALILVFANLACSFSGSLNSNEGLTVNIELQESDLNSILERSNSRIDDEDALLKDVDQVDFQDGLVRVFGTYDLDGVSGEGSYDVAVSAEDGALVAEIVGVDIEGVSLDDPRIERINEELSRELAESAQESQGEVEFTNVEVTDDVMKLSVRIMGQQ
jgi:hypothetical protein